MKCTQCGSSNNDSDVLCKECGAPLDKDPKKPVINTHNGLVTALIAAGVLLIAAAVALILVLGGGISPIGPWHNEELGQLLRFHEDETVVIRTPYGDSEAVYVYDKSGGKGVITLNGEAISFALQGDNLQLTWNGVQTSFLRGDMEVVPAIAEATPPVTLTPAATPTPEVTPAATPTPTAMPTEAPSATSSYGPFPSVSMGPIPTLGPVKSIGVIIPGDILGNIAGSIVGDWAYTEDPEYVLTFTSDGIFMMANQGMGIGGTYTYDKTTKTGVIEVIGSTLSFSVNSNILTTSDGSTYERVS